MVIMVSFRSSSSKVSEIYDPIRKKWVAALPEEVVRQELLQKMMGLGYPKSHIAVEKELKELPHLAAFTTLPERRIDVLCFAHNIHPYFPLYPLLLIECKEGYLRESAFEQLMGYNDYVKAPFLAIVTEDTVEVFYNMKNSVQSVRFLPSYEELLGAVCSQRKE